MLESERKMLEDVSAELRNEVHTLKEILNSNIEYIEPSEQEDSQYTQTAPYQRANSPQVFENQSYLPK